MTAAGDAGGPPQAQAAEGDRQPEIDWKAAEESPEFKELIARKRRFVLPSTIFFLAWFFGFVLLCGYAPEFMGEEFLTDGLTVGYVLAFTQFIMVWVLCWLYVRLADSTFDPLGDKAAEKALQVGRDSAASRSAGAERPTTPGTTGEVAPQ